MKRIRFLWSRGKCNTIERLEYIIYKVGLHYTIQRACAACYLTTTTSSWRGQLRATQQQMKWEIEKGYNIINTFAAVYNQGHEMHAEFLRWPHPSTPFRSLQQQLLDPTDRVAVTWIYKNVRVTSEMQSIVHCLPNSTGLSSSISQRSKSVFV